MCIAFIGFNYSNNYPLIIALNRDEFYSRPTESADFWRDTPNILAGKDLEKGGTWFGITEEGRVALLTNHRGFQECDKSLCSRGELVSKFLTSRESVEDFSKHLVKSKKDYNGYNLIFGEIDKLYYFSNKNGDHLKKLGPGFYGLSNHFLDTPWPKLRTGKKNFEKISWDDSFCESDLITKSFSILQDTTVPPEDEIPRVGLDPDFEKMTSSIFVKSNEYGTRTSTLLFINDKRQTTFVEKSYNSDGELNTLKFNF